MKLFILLTLALLADSGKKKSQKDIRKQFHKCKQENCSDRCDGGNHQEGCYACIKSNCEIPKRIVRIHQCMIDSCDCVDVESENCQQCKKQNCLRQKQNTPKSKPLALLDKVWKITEFSSTLIHCLRETFSMN